MGKPGFPTPLPSEGGWEGKALPEKGWDNRVIRIGATCLLEVNPVSPGTQPSGLRHTPLFIADDHGSLYNRLCTIAIVSCLQNEGFGFDLGEKCKAMWKEHRPPTGAYT